MRLLNTLLTVTFCLPALTLADEAAYKIQLDPTMAAAGYANLQVDRAINPVLSAGLMAWHLDRRSWGYNTVEESSYGIRIDWFEQGVFESGWHSNAMVKVDLEDGRYARTRVKLTQTYQFHRGTVYVNLGIGAQFVSEADAVRNELYQYRSWLLPAWEFSVGRAF